MAIFADAAPMEIIGLFVTVGSFVLHIIGFSTTYWFKDGPAHFGLWQSCGQVTETSPVICLNIADLPDQATYPGNFKGAQALECIALVAFFAAVVFAVLKVFVMKDSGAVYVMTSLANFAAALFGIIGVILFATLSVEGIRLDSSKFHFSFGLCIVASIGGIFSGIVFLLAWRWVYQRR